MHTGLTDQALDAFGLIDDAVRVRFGLVHLTELASLRVPLRCRVEDLLEAGVLAVLARRKRLGDMLADGEFVPHDAGRILQRLLGLDGAVDHALGHLVMTVLVGHVFQHTHASFWVEIGIDIRQGHTFGVQEPFEDQAMLQRVEFGDAHGVGDHRACGGATAGADHHAVVLRPVDVVGDDQEVAAELHLADHAALVVGLLQHIHRHIALVALLQALLHLLEEQRGLVPAFRAGELRHERAVLAVVEHHVAAFGHLDRIVTGLGQVLEQRTHLLGGFQVVAGTVEFETVGVIQPRTGVDAQHRVLCAAILLQHVMGVVRGQQRRVEPFGDVQEFIGHLGFDLQTVVHQFDVEVVTAVDVLQFAGVAQCLIELTEAQTGLDDARRTARTADHALGIGGEHLVVHTRIAHHAAFEIGHRGCLQQVLQAFIGFRPQCQVGDQAAAGHVVGALCLGAPMHAGLVLPGGFRRGISLDADDRFDTDLDGLAPHLVRAVHVAVVGDADGRHAQLLGAPHQVGNLGRTVQQRVMRMVVQLHEVTT